MKSTLSSVCLLSRKVLPYFCLFALNASSRADIVSDFATHRLGLADDRATPNAFLGGSGQGWVRNWIFEKHGTTVHASGVVRNEEPLTPEGGNYVQVTTRSEGEKGAATLYRIYEAYEDVDLAGVRTVKFLFRLDSSIEEFSAGSINISEDATTREIGGSWWISVPGGEHAGAPMKGRKQEVLVWNFYHGARGADFHGDSFISSEMPLEEGVTYRFEVTQDPVKRLWKATISNGTQTVTTRNPENVDSPWLNYRYQSSKTVAVNPAGRLLFHVSVAAGHSLTYAMSGLRIEATETE